MSRRVLVVGPAWVGDLVMAQSLFKLLKQRRPTVLIDVLAPRWPFPLLARMPEVSEAILLPFEHGELKLKERYQLGKALREKGHGQAIVLPHSFKAALVPWFARIPKRTGWLGEGRYGALNDVRYLNKRLLPRTVDQFAALGLPPDVALPLPLPVPCLQVFPSSQQSALAKHQLVWRGGPVLALCPGAAFGPSKRWPHEYYAYLARAKLEEGWEVWLFGSQQDRMMTDAIMKMTAHRCQNLAGKLGLDETVDLLSLVTGAVTNDSGLMHIAAALQKPMVVLYGPSSPRMTPPLSKQADLQYLGLSCQPCFKRHCPLGHHRCMIELAPHQVIMAMRKWA